MKHFLIASVAALAFASAGAAIAQAPQQPMKPMRMTAPQTRADVQAHVQAMFAKLDANRDGFIDKAEAEAMKAKMHDSMGEPMAKRSAADRGGAFDRLDANHDGAITREEFDSAMQGHGGMKMMHAGMPHMGGKMFERADANHDGRLSVAEAQQAALAHFDMLDLNHDGTITPDERQQARQLRMQRKPS